MIDRRRLLAASPALALGGVVAQPARAQVTPISASDMAMGAAGAGVQVIEYASLSCPHCAEWHANVWPSFKRRYVDTGQVRFAIREFLTEPAAVSAAGFMLARCAPRARYYQSLDVLFAAQRDILQASGPLIDTYARLGTRFGLSPARVRACLTSQANLEALNARVERNSAAGIRSTPTFVVGDQMLAGRQSLAQLSAAIDPLLSRRGRNRS